MREIPTLKGGFDNIGPLRRNGSSVRVAFRPVDHLLEERITTLIAEVCAQGVPKDIHLAMAIRSVDGFFVTAKGSDPIRGPLALVRVIEYDPSRQIFLVSGDRDPDTWAVAFWYCFRVFENDGVACAFGKGGDLELPEDASERSKALLGVMSDWKRKNPVMLMDRELYRCPSLDRLKEYLASHLKGKDEVQERSQGS